MWCLSWESVALRKGRVEGLEAHTSTTMNITEFNVSLCENIVGSSVKLVERCQSVRRHSGG